MAHGNRAGIDLRAAHPADAAEIAALLAREGMAATPRDVAAGLEALGRGTGQVLVATGWTGAVIGLIALHWSPELIGGRPSARIGLLAVAEEERGNGVGRLLLKAGAQAARAAGCDVLHAAAPPGAAAGRAFLLATGFEASGEEMRRPLRRR